MTLQLLQTLTAQCGVSFPCTPSSSSSSSSLQPHLTVSSIHLVHTVRDDTSLEVVHRHFSSSVFSYSHEFVVGLIHLIQSSAVEMQTYLQ